MGSNETPNVLLFGAGSVGAVYLYLLSKVASVTAVCRSNYEVVKENGFVVNSSIFGQNLHFTPKVVQTCTEAALSTNGRPFDYILVCSKAMPGTIPELIKPAVTPGHTAIVLIQNGIAIEEEYGQAFPNNTIVSCVVYMPATQRPAGVITHGEIELLELGTYPASRQSEHAANLAALLKSAGATVKLYEDIQKQRWLKLIINAPWNPLCAITMCTDVELMRSSPHATALVRDIMLEVAGIAAAHGHPISYELVDFQLGRAQARIPTNTGVEPSMLQDAKDGRRMEVEAIVGNTVRMGKEREVPCPKLEMLYVLATALDSHIKRRRDLY
jgi:2-dehydropantoate 2-reductase